MTSFGKFTLRFAVYGVVVIYLACDLLVFHGPLYHRLQASKLDSAESIADAKKRGVAAVVYGREIILAQIDYAVRARLRQSRGDSSLENLSPDQLRLHRYAALGDLIDHEILRVKVMHSSSELAVSDEEIDAALARIAMRFPSDDAFHEALESSGVTSDDYRARIAARLQQIKFAESRIDPHTSPADPLARHRAASNFRQALRDHEAGRDRILIRHDVF
jgi:hypothetical protein